MGIENFRTATRIGRPRMVSSNTKMIGNRGGEREKGELREIARKGEER